MSSTTLIRGAEVVFPDHMAVANIVLQDGLIASIDAPADFVADQVIDAAGLILIPGVIDDQVHFREPGLTHKEDLRHASRACAKGGVTSFLEMPNTVPTTTTVERLHQKLELASTQSLVNYGFYMGATPDNLAELQRAQRTPGIKIFIGSSTGDLLVDEQAALERIFGETHLPICAHCEDEATVRRNQERWAGITDVAIHSKIRDHQAAVTCTLRALDLAQRHGHQFHVLHVSTADELPILQAAPDYITAEVCPHHLFFSIDDYARLGSLIKMNPSIKTRRDCAALWQGLLDGTIDLIATDHAPHTWEEKQQPYPACPSGLPAVENSLALIANQVALGLCTWPQLVKWMCQRPAEVWHIPQKGRIQVGYHADVVLVDPQLQQTIRHEQQLTKSRWSPWHGTTLTGWPVRTWVGGHQVYEWTPNGPNLDESRCGGEIHFDPARKTRFS